MPVRSYFRLPDRLSRIGVSISLKNRQPVARWHFSQIKYSLAGAANHTWQEHFTVAWLQEDGSMTRKVH